MSQLWDVIIYYGTFLRQRNLRSIPPSLEALYARQLRSVCSECLRATPHLRSLEIRTKTQR